MNKTTIFSLAACAAMAALPQSSPAQTVGTAGAVNPSTQGTAPGGGTRQVTLGSQVIFKERFVTSPQGSLQLVFLDKSTLNIGPNSDVVINEYVYDPNTRDGKMSVGLAKGALRFVGGQISHNGNAEIKTPVATIGLRGAVAVTSYDPQQQTSTTSSIVGTTTVTSNVGGTVTMVQGYTTTVGQGQPPSPPSRTPPQILANTTGQTTSQAGQTGGTSQPPSNQSANTQLGGDGSQAPTILANVTSTNRVTQQASTLTQTVTDTRQTTQVTSTTTSVQPVVQSIQTALAPRAIAYTLGGQGAGGSIPFLTALFVGNGQVFNTPLLGYRVGGDPNLLSSETIRTFQVGFGINGRGANQSSVLSVATGAIFNSGTETIFNGGVGAATRAAGNRLTAFANSSTSSIPGTVNLPSDRSGIPTSFSIDQNDFNRANQPVADIASQFGGQIPGAGNDYTFTQSAVAVAPSAGLGSNRPTLTLNGYSGGVLETARFNSSGNRIQTQLVAVTGTSGNGGDVTLTLNGANSRAQADIQLSSRTVGSNFQSGSFLFGNLDGTQSARSAYVDINAFALRDRTSRDPNTTAPATDTPAPFTSSAGSGVYTNIQSGLTSYNTIITQNPAAAQAIIQATDITPCACEFTQWGFWNTRSVRNDSTTGGTTQERGNLLLWVAGQLSDRSLVPTVGSATYNGHIIGNVQSGTGTGVGYIAGGTFSHTVNFGQGTGTLAFTFDQRNYAGTSALNSANRANFSGSFATVAGPSASGSLQGSFFGPNTGAGTAPLEQGGQFTISGAPPSGPGNYIAAGIFAARR